MHSVKFGIIPLGKENRFFKQCFPDQARQLPARFTDNVMKCCKVISCRVIGEAARTIVEGNGHPKSVMQLRSSEGNTIYALQQASWGVFKDAYNKKDRFIISNCDLCHVKLLSLKFLVIWLTTNTGFTHLHCF